MYTKIWHIRPQDVTVWAPPPPHTHAPPDPLGRRFPSCEPKSRPRCIAPQRHRTSNPPPTPERIRLFFHPRHSQSTTSQSKQGDQPEEDDVRQEGALTDPVHSGSEDSDPAQEDHDDHDNQDDESVRDDIEEDDEFGGDGDASDLEEEDAEREEDDRSSFESEEGRPRPGSASNDPHQNHKGLSFARAFAKVMGETEKRLARMRGDPNESDAAAAANTSSTSTRKRVRDATGVDLVEAEAEAEAERRRPSTSGHPATRVPILAGSGAIKRRREEDEQQEKEAEQVTA